MKNKITLITKIKTIIVQTIDEQADEEVCNMNTTYFRLKYLPKSLN